MVILQGVEEKIGHRIPISHPLASWAFKHAAWILNCYCPRNGITPFEAVHGRQFTGRTCPFGEVVMGFVGVENKQKSTAKWMPIMFLGKTSNDMHILARGSSVRLSKSIKRIFPEWFRHIDLYRSFEVHSWMIERTLGTRIKLSPLKHPGRAAIEAGGDQGSDEAASDPESIEGLGVDLSDDTPLLFLKHEVAASPEEAEQVLTSVAEPGTMVVDEATAGVDEPPMKRLKVGQVALVHVDEVDVLHDNEIDVSMFERDDVGYQQGGDDDNLHFETPTGLDDSILWLPFTEEEPVLSQDVLAEMDALADRFEVDRLLTMGVLGRSTGHEDSSNYGSPLTGKFVRTFRKKERDGQLCWYRRSRLVVREYNYLSVREDTFSPASNAVVTRMIPAMVMSGVYGQEHVIGALDISDAYLQVPQEFKRRLKVVDNGGCDDLIIAKCLPGQRDGARRWYFFFCDFLEKQLNMECCKEQPSILKVSKADGGGCMLLHVDDVLFTMTADFMHQKFLPELKNAFKLSVTWVDRKTGGSFEFLKRLHVFDVGFERLDIYGETKHIKQCVAMFRKANGGKAARLHYTPAMGHVFSGRDETPLLGNSMSGTYRSLVGCILYLSDERSDVQHTIKCLASYLSSRTQHAWTQLGRLIGYLQRTSGYGVQMRGTQPGMSLFEKLAEAGKQNCEYSCLVENSQTQIGKVAKTFVARALQPTTSMGTLSIRVPAVSTL